VRIKISYLTISGWAIGCILSACSHFYELQGTWIGYEAHRPSIDWKMVVQGEHFELICSDPKIWHQGLVKLNNNCRRKKIDFKICRTSERSCSGKTLRGIYEIENDLLTIVASEGGAQFRPESLEEFERSALHLFLRRI
jgi:uncharacterized protein (TIGR03067 family)